MRLTGQPFGGGGQIAGGGSRESPLNGGPVGAPFRLHPPVLPPLAEFGAQPAVDTLQSGELLIFRNISASPESRPSALHFFQNVGGLGSPQIRLGFLIVPVNVTTDRLLQFAHIMKDAPPNALVG